MCLCVYVYNSERWKRDHTIHFELYPMKQLHLFLTPQIPYHLDKY